MKWSVEEIRTFLDVMEAGTVSGAAARANLSKSVISKRISDLEATLGTALFRRHAGRITPTEGAEELALRLRPALAEMNDAVESAAWGMAGLRGTLAIAAPMSFGISHLSPVVADFARQHPDLAITLDYDDRAVDLVRGRFDLAVRIGQLRDSGLIAHRLCEDPRVIVASPDYVIRRGMPESLDDLHTHASIGYLNVHAASVWQFRGGDGTPTGIAMQSRVTANNGEAMRDMAIAGLGVALLPLFVAHEALRQGRLVRIAPKLTPLPLPISLVWPPVKPLPMKLRAIVDHLAKAFAERPPWLD